MSFSQMPAEMLTMILLNKDIPLQQRICLRRVAKTWLDIIEPDLKKQTKLVLYGNRDDHPRAKDDLVLSETKFTAEFVQQFVQLFPFIADLALTIFPKANYQQLSKLLMPYRATLTSLSLTGQHKEVGHPIVATIRLVNALNALPNLTSLNLSGYRLKSYLFEKMAPTLARLERFTLKHERPTDRFGVSIIASLSPRCTTLLLPASCLPLPWWDNINNNISDSLTDLIIDKTNNWHEWGVRFLNHFHVLRRLRVNFNRVLLDTDLLRRFSSLQQITEMELVGLLFISGHLTIPLDDDRPLDNVKQLTLELIVDNLAVIITEEDIHHFWLALSAWFPTLERLTIQCDEQYQPIFKTTLEQVAIDCVISIKEIVAADQ